MSLQLEFVPPTLWPFNIQDVLEDCLADLEQGKHLNPRPCLLIELLPEPPDEQSALPRLNMSTIFKKELTKIFFTTQAKYAQNELAIKSDPQLRRQWARIKSAFNVQIYRDHKGVIRRSMSAERNLRPSFSVNMRRRDGVFQAAFDALCLRWNLYGMQNDEPLPAQTRSSPNPLRNDDSYSGLLVIRSQARYSLGRYRQAASRPGSRSPRGHLG